MEKQTHAGSPLPSRKTRNNQISKQISFWMGVCLILLTACARTPAATPEPTAGGASSIVILTFTPAPTDLPSSPEASMTTLEPSPEVAATGRIPGLSPRNVTVALEHNQFTCTLPVKGSVYYERTCTRGVPGVQVFRAVIYGKAPGAVDFIEASILQSENPKDEIAIPILNLIATLPYDGSNPDEARAWVESTVPTLNGGTQETMFGDVKYVLSGPPTKLTLEIGELP